MAQALNALDPDHPVLVPLDLPEATPAGADDWPTGLRLARDRAVAFACLRLDSHLDDANGIARDLVQAFPAAFGIDAGDLFKATPIESFMMLYVPSSRGDQFLEVYAVRTPKSYDRSRLLASLLPERTEHKVASTAYYTSAKTPATTANAPVSDRVYLFGKPEAIESVLGDPAPGPADASWASLVATDPSHFMTFGVRLAGGPPDKLAGNLPAAIEPLSAETAQLMMRMEESPTLQLELNFADQEAAARATGPAREGIGSLRPMLAGFEWSLVGGDSKDATELVRQLGEALRSAKPRSFGAVLVLTLPMPADFERTFDAGVEELAVWLVRSGKMPAPDK